MNDTEENQQPEKRKRGRPKKNINSSTASNNHSQGISITMQEKYSAPENSNTKNGMNSSSDTSAQDWAKELEGDSSLPHTELLQSNTDTIGIGNRENARTVEAATGAQYWVGLPEGAENDALPRVKQRLAQLDSIANDPRKVALDYIQTVERRLEGDFKKETGTKLIHDFDLDDFGDVINEAFGDNDTELMYQLLKADLEGHLQIIETPKVINFLSEHLQEQYRDCATGRVIKFQSSMLMTCNSLKDWEICDSPKDDASRIALNPKVRKFYIIVPQLVIQTLWQF